MKIVISFEFTHIVEPSKYVPGKHGAQKSKLTLKKPDLETSQDILLHLKNILCTTECQPLTKNCVSRIGVIQKVSGQNEGGGWSKTVNYCPRS